MTPDTTLAALRAGRLAGATRLDLRGLGLTEVPPEVLELGDTLEHLDLSANALRRLPDALPRLGALRVLFASDNRFDALPAVLGRCPSLEIVGFRANAIAHLPPEALPTTLRWLILTDNRLEALPETLGRCVRLQKLMLAGNRLRAWPASIGACRRLELVRLAANAFESAAAALPEALLALPALAWLAAAGNPFDADREARAAAGQGERIDAAALRLGERLGEGASGVIHAANWQPAGAPPREVAVKRFKGAVTSDGLPASEMAACLAAGAHPNLLAAIGRLAAAPGGAGALVMPRVPARYRVLAGPPSLATCSRDVYPEDRRFGVDEAVALARGVADALGHLHARGLLHGDLYAHNVLADDAGHALLGDFGAATFLPHDDPGRADALRRLDRRALDRLVEEIAARCDDPAAVRGAGLAR